LPKPIIIEGKEIKGKQYIVRDGSQNDTLMTSGLVSPTEDASQKLVLL
jgi:hypothetical protein